MKKIPTILVFLLILCFTSVITSQSNKSEQLTPRTEIDNIGYWVDMAKMGLVPFNPAIPFTPAEEKGSEIVTAKFITNSPDVVIYNEAGNTQSENSVFVDPNDNSHIFNSNNSEQSGSIYGSSYFYTSDFGLTWTGSKLGTGGTNSGDPAACIGLNGRSYDGFIYNNGQAVAYSDNGTSWTRVVVGANPGPYPDLLDKNHLWIDNTNSGQEGNVYDAWTRFDAGHANNNQIEFSRSTNDGLTWSTPYQISSAIAAGSHNQGVNIQCNNTGWVFATWVVYDDWGTGVYGEDAIAFARSSNGGVSFNPAVRIHNNISGIRGWVPTNATGKNLRVNSFPSMTIDVSGGPYHGHQYIVWANIGVPGVNTGTNVSIYMMKSTNGGTIWSTPIRVNQGTTANDYASFFPWITSDPVTGNLYCIFYDDRNLGSTSSAVETWLAYSNDGGATWNDFRISDVSFTPAPIPGLADGYMGDYLGVSARDGHVYPVWTDNRSGRALTYVSPLNFGGSCIATGGLCDEYINNVTIGTINNSSSCNGYEDFRAISTNVPVNASVPITVSNSTAFYPTDQCGIWVDWNRDDDFYDANETITVSGTPGVGPYTANIAPPIGATLGACTMRIRINYGAVDPCGTTTYGEVEDYTLNITGAVNNVWNGSFNHYWHNAANWSLNRIPIAIDPVLIPNVGYQPVYIDNYPGFTNEICSSLTINSGASVQVWDMALNIEGNLNIYGQLSMTDALGVINIQGNWNNNVGAAGFAEGPGKVVFNGGAYHQYCTNETFNILELNKPSGGAFRPYLANNVVCAAYDWTAGAIDVITGSFTTNDLLDNGIFGAYYCNPGGTINLNNLAGNQWVDLNCELHIYGGTVNVSGSVSDWPYASNASIEMSDGVLDFKTCGININNTSYTLTDNITGGTIRTAYGFSGNRADFTPTAGIFELYGSGDAYISQSNGCTLNNVVINKATKESMPYSVYNVISETERADKTKGNGGKANTISLLSDFTITNTLSISSGTLNIGGFECLVAKSTNVYGALSMTDPLGVFSSGTLAYDNLRFYPGSTANLSDGKIHLKSWIAIDAGANFTESTNHTLYIIGGNFGGGLANSEPTAVFGNVVMNKTFNPTVYLASDYFGPYHIQGNLTIFPGNSLQTGNNSVHLNGILYDSPSSSIYLYYASKYNSPESMTTKGIPGNIIKSAGKNGLLEIDTDYTLNGLLDVYDGNALVHGIFHLASTGNLNITSGSFIADSPLHAKGWEYIDGHISLTTGLFEISHNSINFSGTGTSTISGGTVRSGEAFGAVNVGNFQPTGGAVEIVGVGQNYIYCNNGNYFYNLVINRDPSAGSYLNTIITVNNNLTVNSGTMNLYSSTANVLGGVTLNGGNLLVNENSNLLMASGTVLNVNNGGKLSVIGLSGMPGRISRISTGYYGLNVQSGGTIAAQYGTFEYMNTAGVNLLSGSLVDPINSFNFCTFRNGQSGGRLISIENNQTFNVESAVFPTNTWSGAYNVYKSVNAGMVNFIMATGPFSGESFDYDPYNRVNWTQRLLSLKVYLEGPFNGTNMNTSINSILPLSHPFNPALPYFGNPLPDWRYTGSGSVGAIPNVNIVDWVLIELRDAPTAASATKATMVAQIPAFITNNGNIVALNGSTSPEFSNAIVNNLYVVIYQRNHVSIMNANLIPYAAGTYTYDFTTGAAQVYGGAAAHKQLATGKWGMRSGDGNGDCDVLSNDKTAVWSLPGQLGKTGYLPSDYNLDRQTNNKDKNDKWLPNLGSGSSVPN